MRPKDEAAIYSIETDSYLAQPLTNNILRLEQTIAMFGKPEGGTSLFDAIVGAATYLKPYAGRRVIVIVSDGNDTNSRTGIGELRSMIRESEVLVYAIGIDGAGGPRSAPRGRRHRSGQC